MPPSVFRTKNNRGRRFIFGETGHWSSVDPGPRVSTARDKQHVGFYIGASAQPGAKREGVASTPLPHCALEDGEMSSDESQTQHSPSMRAWRRLCSIHIALRRSRAAQRWPRAKCPGAVVRGGPALSDAEWTGVGARQPSSVAASERPAVPGADASRRRQGRNNQGTTQRRG